MQSESAVTFRLPTELLDHFKAVAAADQRSLSGELRWLIERRIAEREQTTEAAA